MRQLLAPAEAVEVPGGGHIAQQDARAASRLAAGPGRRRGSGRSRPGTRLHVECAQPLCPVAALAVQGRCSCRRAAHGGGQARLLGEEEIRHACVLTTCESASVESNQSNKKCVLITALSRHADVTLASFATAPAAAIKPSTAAAGAQTHAMCLLSLHHIPAGMRCAHTCRTTRCVTTPVLTAH